MIGKTAPVIAGQGWRAYLTPMPALLTKLLTLIALALMPLGMGAAPALAQPAMVHAATAESHCPDPTGDSDHEAPQAADCAMGCTALPAAAAVDPAPLAAAPQLARPLVQRNGGLHPEAATPPPKRA